MEDDGFDKYNRIESEQIGLFLKNLSARKSRCSQIPGCDSNKVFYSEERPSQNQERADRICWPSKCNKERYMIGYVGLRKPET